MPAPPPPNTSRNPLRALVAQPKSKAPPPPPDLTSSSSSAQLLDDLISKAEQGTGGCNHTTRLFVGRVIKEGVASKSRLWARKKPGDETLGDAVSVKFNASIQMAVITEFNEDTNLRVTIPFSELGSVIVSGNPQLRFMSSRDAFTMLVSFASDKVRDEVHELTCAVRACGILGLELFQALDPGFTGSVPTHAVAHLVPRHMLEEHRVRQTLQSGYAQHDEISFWNFIVMLAKARPTRNKSTVEDSRITGENDAYLHDEDESHLNKWVQTQISQIQAEQSSGQSELPTSVPLQAEPSPSESTSSLAPIKIAPAASDPVMKMLNPKTEDLLDKRSRTLKSPLPPAAPVPPPTMLDRYTCLPGEVVLHRRALGDVRFVYRNYPRLTPEDLKANAGGLLLTNFGLGFVPCSRALECLCIPFGNINIVELDQDTLILTTKDLFIYKWAIASVVSEDQPRSGESPAESTYKVLYNLSFPIDLNLLFAFTSARSTSSSVPQEPRRFFPHLPVAVVGGPPVDGWLVYNPIKEFDRLGLLCRDLSGSALFRPYYNKNGRLSPSYPSLFLVPNSLTDAELVKVSCHRSKGRVPAVVYIHPNTGATLARCSQPFVGVKGFVGGGNRCSEEEKLIEALLNANPTNTKTLYFVDLRGNTAASGNQLMGKGTEHVSYYRNTQLKFMGIGNIHAVRSAYEKLATLCHADTLSLMQGDNDWDKKFYETHWLQHLRTILHAASQMVVILSVEGASIVSHCSDGWDRTPSVVSLVQLLLDPFFRTKRGFAVLIEKEWCSYGHKFAERLGQGQPNHTSDQRSPIFFQWLECIYQVLRQHPQEFEFSEEFLLGLATEVTSCRYGTFLYDTELERIEEDVRGRTASIWTDFLNEKAYPHFSNQNFHPTRITLTVDYTKRLVLWERYWLRFEAVKAPPLTRAEKEKELKDQQQQQTLADLQSKYQALEGFIKEHDASADIAEIANGFKLRRPRGGGASSSANTSPTRTPLSPRPRSGSVGTAVDRPWASRTDANDNSWNNGNSAVWSSTPTNKTTTAPTTTTTATTTATAPASSASPYSFSSSSFSSPSSSSSLSSSSSSSCSPSSSSSSSTITDGNSCSNKYRTANEISDEFSQDVGRGRSRRRENSPEGAPRESDSKRSTVISSLAQFAPLSPSSGTGTAKVALAPVGEEDSETRERSEVTTTEDDEDDLSKTTAHRPAREDRYNSLSVTTTMDGFPPLEDAGSPPPTPPTLPRAPSLAKISGDLVLAPVTSSPTSSLSSSSLSCSSSCTSFSASSACSSSVSPLPSSLSTSCSASNSTPLTTLTSALQSSCSASPHLSPSVASCSPLSLPRSLSSSSLPTAASCSSPLASSSLASMPPSCGSFAPTTAPSPITSASPLSSASSSTPPNASLSPVISSTPSVPPPPSSLSFSSKSLSVPALHSSPTLVASVPSLTRSSSSIRPPPPPSPSCSPLAACSPLSSGSWDSDLSSFSVSNLPSTLGSNNWDSTLDLWDFSQSQRNSVSTTLDQTDSARSSVVVISNKASGGSPVKITSNQPTQPKPPPPPPGQSTLRKAATFAAGLRARLDKPTR